jgi:hypothetical protein
MPEGLEDVLREVDKVTKTVTADSLQGAENAGYQILDLAKRNCPVKTGRMRNSGYVHVLGYEVEIGFDTPYAATVHEDTSANHDTGEAKFLETPFKSADRLLPEAIVREARLQ